MIERARVFARDEDFGLETSMEEYEKLLFLPENETKKIELIDGYLVMMAGNASFNHHRISGFIFSEIHHYLRGKICEVAQDINVYLFNESIGECKNVYQPDIMVGCDKERMTDRGYEGTPDLIIEVVSKSTARNDYFVKLNRYIDFGVKEYWIVDLDKNQIMVYLNDGDGPPTINKYTFDNVVKVGVFDDLYIDFNEVLRSVDVGT